MATLLCVVFASCGNKEVPPCETHTDADGNLVCDVCQATITPAGPSPAELENEDKNAIVEQINGSLSSWVSLITGNSSLEPVTFKSMMVETNLSSKHWVSRLNKISINDHSIYMSLKNDNKYSNNENKDVIVSILPTGIYAIQDDTMSINVTTHLYTAEQKKVITEECTFLQIGKNADGTYNISNEYLVSIFMKLLQSQTAMELCDGLYDRQFLRNIESNLLSDVSITLNDENVITKCSVKMYTKNNGLTTDICTVVYENVPAKTHFKISFNMNYMLDMEYTRNSSSTYLQSNYEFKMQTSKQNDNAFKGKQIQIIGVLSKDKKDVVAFNNDIVEKMDKINNTFVYTDMITKKYDTYYTVNNADWQCKSVYVYDERYDAYILFKNGPDMSSKQVAFNSIEFNVDLTNACIGTLNFQSKRIDIVQHSDEEMLTLSLKNKYNIKWTANKYECLSVAVYDSDANRYVLFKRMVEGETFYYAYNGVSATIDKTTTCVGEVNFNTSVLRFTEHNTNHTSH
jgi:hypothetical protein